MRSVLPRALRRSGVRRLHLKWPRRTSRLRDGLNDRQRAFLTRTWFEQIVRRTRAAKKAKA